MGRTSIWIPLALTEKERTNRATGWLNVIGRLKPQITLNTAQQTISAIAQQLEKQYPDFENIDGRIYVNLQGLSAPNTKAMAQLARLFEEQGDTARAREYKDKIKREAR